MRPFLVCGFEPFAEHRENPSGWLATQLASPECVARLLPVIYTKAERRIITLLRTLDPAGVLLLGLWEGNTFKLERRATNLDHSVQPDESGDVRMHHRIRARGPLQVKSSLPLPVFATELKKRNLAYTHSVDAGGFVCNHVFYVAALRCLKTSVNTPCGLIHVPPATAIPLEDQRAGLAACLDRMKGHPTSDSSRSQY